MARGRGAAPLRLASINLRLPDSRAATATERAANANLGGVFNVARIPARTPRTESLSSENQQT